MPETHTTFLQKFSLERALKDIFVPEESNKILGFSLFKLFSLPFLAYGFNFYLNNYGSANYFSFNE